MAALSTTHYITGRSLVSLIYSGDIYAFSCGEILSPPENSFPQTIVLRYQEISGILCTKQRRNGTVSILRIFRHKLNFIFDALHTIYPRFL
jgi:hypothetical protein